VLLGESININIKRLRRSILILPLIFIFLLPFSVDCIAQKAPRVANLPKFEHRLYHFGFLLAVNQMDFALKTIDDYKYLDSLVYVTTKPSLGFSIGIVSQVRIYKNLQARFVPTLSFGDRSVEYTVTQGDTMRMVRSKRVESTFMEFPLLIKYTSKRLVNAQAFVIAGAKYTIDMASQANKKNKSFEVPIKLNRSDVLGEVGTGFDFFLTYFKFGIELKMSYGFLDLLKRENNIFTNPVKRLGSKVFQLSFTFEG
jgi:hypothetical protein